MKNVEDMSDEKLKEQANQRIGNSTSSEALKKELSVAKELVNRGIDEW